MNDNELGIYIHIPFCMRKCYYCDFISYEDCNEQTINEYINTVVKEINYYDFKKYDVTTIYFGGGTPSFIKETHIEKILNALKDRIDKDFKNIEITIEVNPRNGYGRKIKKI